MAKKKKYVSKLNGQILPHIRALTEGTVLAIDPSSGSQNSQPGYAIFEAGRFKDGGIIKIQAGQELHHRLYLLGKTLREQFDKPDILVTEYIPPIAGGGGFSANHMLSLQQSIGVTISSFDCPMVKVSPMTWRKYIDSAYVKRDDNDALMLAFTAIREAQMASHKPEHEWLTYEHITQHFNLELKPTRSSATHI